jgi:rubrerythrin
MNPIMQKALEERERREREKKAAEDSKGSSFDFGSIEYLSLEDQKEKVFRIIGKPPELRDKPTDPKFVLQSSILRDDKKGYIKINWPFIIQDGKFIPDPDWILTKLYKKVYEGEWKNYEDGHVNAKGKKGEWFHFHKDTDIFRRIEGNGKEGDQFPKRFYPSVKVLLSVLDRQDDWCATNKKFKLLTSKSAPYEFTDTKGEKKVIYFRETGIPKSAYDAVFDHFAKINSYWEDTDTILVKRSKSKDYVAWDMGDARYLKPETIALAKDTPLTEEEKQYEAPNLDMIGGDSSYNKLKKNLSGLFKLADTDLKESFYDELLALVEKENAEKAALKAQNKEVTEESEEDQKQPDVASSTPPLTNQETVHEPNLPLVSIDSIKDAFPNFDKLSKEDQVTFQKSIQEINGTIPVYFEWVDDYYCYNKQCNFKNSDKRTTYPGNVLICPVCGTIPPK